MNAISPISAVSALTGTSGASSIGSIGGTSSIAGTSSVGGSNTVDGTAAGTQAPGDSFLNSLSDAFSSLNTQLSSADTAVADFASCGSADLHTVMLQMEEASISLKAATDVQSKLIDAYQDIMRTQV